MKGLLTYKSRSNKVVYSKTYDMEKFIRSIAGRVIGSRSDDDEGSAFIGFEIDDDMKVQIEAEARIRKWKLQWGDPDRLLK